MKHVSASSEGEIDASAVIGSLQEHFIRCLICGKRFKLLAPHVVRLHGLTSQQYRAKFGLRPTEGLTCADLKRRQAAHARKLREAGIMRKANMRIGARGRKFIYTVQELVERADRYRLGHTEHTGTLFQLELAKRSGTVTVDESRAAFLHELRTMNWDGTPTMLKRLGVKRIATGLFQPIGNLYRAYGVPGPPRHVSWSKNGIADAIRNRRGAGNLLNSAAVKREDPKLIGAARHHFGRKQGWNRALEYAGIRPESVMKQRSVRRPRMKKEIVEWIRMRARRGKATNGLACIRDHEFGPYRDAERLFGSIEQAVKAAGLPESVIGRKGAIRRWNRERIIRTIRERKRKRLALNYSTVVRDDRKLLRAALSHFGRGGWRKAVNAAKEQ